MTITDLDHLIHARIIIAARNSDFHVDITKFTKDLNHFIHGYGSIGYEDAEKYNLMMSRPYIEAEAQDLLNQIQQSMRLDRFDLRIEEIDEVPHGMAGQLAMETGGGSFTVSDARKGDIRYGLLRGYELLGFVSGKVWGDVLSVGGLYLKGNYRKKGLSTKLLRCMMEEVESRGLNGILLSDASWQGQDALKRLKKYYDSIGRTDLHFKMGSEDERNYAELTLKKQAGTEKG